MMSAGMMNSGSIWNIVEHMMRQWIVPVETSMITDGRDIVNIST